MKRKLFFILAVLLTLLATFLFTTRAAAGKTLSDLSRGKGLAALMSDIVAPFDWYRFQGDYDAGDCAIANLDCGAAAVAMVIQYTKDENIPLTEIRQIIGGTCHQRTTSYQLDLAMKVWSVKYQPVTTIDQITAALKNGQPVMTLVDMSAGNFTHGADYRTADSPPSENTNLYVAPGPHWLVLKGITDDGKWVIAYDPDVFKSDLYQYAGGALKGQDRYYQTVEIGKNLITGKDDQGHDLFDFDILDTPTPHNFSGGVTSGGTAIDGATVTFSDLHARYTPILSGPNGAFAFNSFFPQNALVTAVKGNQIGAAKGNPYQDQIIKLQNSKNVIKLPSDGYVRVTFIGTGSPGDQTSCSGPFALQGGATIFNDYLLYSGLSYDFPQLFKKNTQLVFSITPGSFCGGKTYLSTDPTRALVANPMPDTWVISWEDYTDNDFNDLTVRVDLYPQQPPTLKSPVAAQPPALTPTRAPEAAASAAAPLPQVEYYFDHKYPADPNANTDSYSSAVTFSGFDSVESYFKYQMYQSYTGNNGTDFKISAGTPVLPVADGTVKFSGTAQAYCPLVGMNLIENVIKVSDVDGYQAEYWGLASLTPGLAPGKPVTIASGQPVGTSGANPCTGNPGFHFVLRNPSGLVVDPFGWDPQPGSHWYLLDDPWKVFNAQHGKDAASYALWDVPLSVPQLVPDQSDTWAVSTSHDVAVFIPAHTSDAPMKVMIDDWQLNTISGLPGSAGSFAINGYGTGDSLVNPLNGQATIYLSLPHNLFPQGYTPTLYFWDPASDQDNKWVALPGTWNAQGYYLTVKTSQFGTFAVK